MKHEYHRWYSPRLGREMGINVYGHYGSPILVFPTSGGDESEYAGQGMIGALQHHIDDGRVKFYCVNSMNNESWYDKQAHPRHRSYVQAMYDGYVAFEVAPFIRDHCQTQDIGITTSGSSFGAYHAANTLLKHPDQFRRCLALSGVYDIRKFMDGDYDDNFYFNNPVDYMASLNDRLPAPPPAAGRHPPRHGQRALRGLGADVPALRGPVGARHPPHRGQLGRRRRARLAVLEEADERIPGAALLDGTAATAPVVRTVWALLRLPHRCSRIGVFESGGRDALSDLKNDLSSLKIDRDRPGASPWRWPLLLLVPVVVLLAVLYGLRVRQAMAAPEVETVRVAVTTAASDAPAGTPMLSASGYLVARRKAVVSAKIQGRLAILKVEEGSHVRERRRDRAPRGRRLPGVGRAGEGRGPTRRGRPGRERSASFGSPSA